MRIQLIDRQTEKQMKDDVADQLQLFQKLVSTMGKPDWVFNLVLVDNDAMARLNCQFREKNTVTDVLSFSYLMEEESPEPCDLSCGDAFAACDLWLDPMAIETGQEGNVVMGEIILAPVFVTTRCLQKNWSVDTEFPLLVVHGALHLLGWDHCQEEETKAMQKLEKQILAGMNLPHPLLDEENNKG